MLSSPEVFEASDDGVLSIFLQDGESRAEKAAAAVTGMQPALLRFFETLIMTSICPHPCMLIFLSVCLHQRSRAERTGPQHQVTDDNGCLTAEKLEIKSMHVCV